MFTYLKLLFYQKKYLYKNFKFLLIRDCLKYIFFILLIIQSIFIFSIRHEILNKSAFLNQITNGNILKIVIVSAIIASHFSIKLTTPLSFEPFWRFGSNNQFFLKSYIYPLFSSTMFILCITLIIILGMHGIVYFAIFYFTYLLTYKIQFVRLIMVIFAVGSHFFLSNESQTLAFTILITSIILLYDWRKSKKIYTKRVKKVTHPLFQSLIIKKEIGYYKYFTSEQYYSVLGVIGYLITIYLISTLSPSDSNLVFFMCFALFMSCFPFMMTLFNLFGMDTGVLDRFFRNPENTIKYQIKRLRMYGLLMFVLHIFLAIQFGVSFKDISVFIEYIIIGFVFVETLLPVSFIYSIFLIDQKEVKFRYGQYIKSRNFNFMQFLLIGLISLFFFTFYFLKIEGIITIGIFTIVLNLIYINKLALKTMEIRRMKGMYGKYKSQNR